MEFPNLVICGNCGSAQASGIQLHGFNRDIQLQNNRQVCGGCGHWMPLPEGVFSSVRAAASVLRERENPSDRIESLKATLQAMAQTPPTSVGEMRQAFQEAGIEQAERLANVAPESTGDKRLWAAALLAAISYAWEKLPQGAVSWIELFEKLQKHLG